MITVIDEGFVRKLKLLVETSGVGVVYRVIKGGALNSIVENLRLLSVSVDTAARLKDFASAFENSFFLCVSFSKSNEIPLEEEKSHWFDVSFEEVLDKFWLRT